VSWRPWLEDRALRQIQGMPSEAFDMLVRTLARICDDPYDPVFSAPVPPVPGRRVADLGDFGFIEFIADEAKGTGPRLLPGVDRLTITTLPQSATWPHVSPASLKECSVCPGRTGHPACRQPRTCDSW
jgi:hypothetical protein